MNESFFFLNKKKMPVHKFFLYFSAIHLHIIYGILPYQIPLFKDTPSQASPSMNTLNLGPLISVLM